MYPHVKLQMAHCELRTEGLGHRAKTNCYSYFAVTLIKETPQNSLIQQASRRVSPRHPSAKAMGIPLGVSFAARTRTTLLLSYLGASSSPAQGANIFIFKLVK